jgi:hypothetical protein
MSKGRKQKEQSFKTDSCQDGREFAIGCYLYSLFTYATRGVAKWAKEVQSLDS